jgi:hypothetical protein
MRTFRPPRVKWWKKVPESGYYWAIVPRVDYLDNRVGQDIVLVEVQHERDRYQFCYHPTRNFYGDEYQDKEIEAFYGPIRQPEMPDPKKARKK